MIISLVLLVIMQMMVQTRGHHGYIQRELAALREKLDEMSAEITERESSDVAVHVHRHGDKHIHQHDAHDNHSDHDENRHEDHHEHHHRDHEDHHSDHDDHHEHHHRDHEDHHSDHDDHHEHHHRDHEDHHNVHDDHHEHHDRDHEDHHHHCDHIHDDHPHEHHQSHHDYHHNDHHSEHDHNHHNDQSKHGKTYRYGRCDVVKNSKLETTPHDVRGSIFFRQKIKEPLEIIFHLTGFHVPQDALNDHTMHNHGIHVHEFGDFSDGCQSFGGHYNPDGVSHGSHAGSTRHAGDWGNIACDDLGEVHSNMTDTQTSLAGTHSIIGRGIVIHEHPDDGGEGEVEASVKTGNAGGRLACCTVVWSADLDWDKLMKHE